MIHKEIPNEWSTAKFGDLLDVKSGFGFKYAEYSPEGIPLVKIDNVSHGKITWNNISYLPQSYMDDYRDILLNEGDILVALNRPITQNKLKIARLTKSDVPSILYQRVGKIVHKDTRLDRNFTFYLLQRDIFYFVRKNAIGSDQPFISITELRKYPLIFPPLPEQHRIAEILSTWDQAITLTEQLITAKQRRKKALMQQLLTGRRRFREFVGSKNIKRTKFGNIPGEWDVKTLGSLVKPITRVEPVLANKDYRLIGVRWYIEGAHIHNILPGSQIMTASLSRIEEGDILYNKMWASKAAFAIAKTQHQDAYGTTEYPQFRAKSDKLSIDFLEYVFHLPRFLYEAKGLCRGTTGRARLNPGDFLKIEIPLPSLPEQRKIAAVLQTCDTEIELLEQKLAALKRQKQGLMRKLLTGQVRVAGEEPSPPAPLPGGEGGEGLFPPPRGEGSEALFPLPEGEG